MSKVSFKKHFRCIKSNSFKELTMEELGYIYKQFLIKDDGKHGVCWEYVICNAIFYGDEYILELLNDAINILTGQNSYDDLEAILWGAEKGEKIIEIAEDNFDEDDVIWTPTKEFLFSEYIN
ncbi:MAG: hypothetical protein ACOCRK_06945 [bacterium]